MKTFELYDKLRDATVPARQDDGRLHVVVKVGLG